MVSDQEIAKAVESLLRQTELQNSVTSINDVVQQLGEKLGLNLSHKTDFIRDQINLVLRSHPQQQQHHHNPPPPPAPPQHHQFQHHPNPHPQKDHFALHSQPPQQHYPQQFPPHFALHPYHPHSAAPPSQPFPPHQVHVHLPPPLAAAAKNEAFSPNASSTVTSPKPPKESAPATGTKRRGGPGGLNKVCGVSPELQAIVGEPALPRTEIVRQLWAYIRKNNLQDPSNKRKIICDDALRIVFETDCTDMFKMNKLLAKHIIALEPSKASTQSKRAKVAAAAAEAEPAPENNDDSSSSVVISEALAKFFGTVGREMVKAEAIRRVWEYVKVNHLEDPVNSMVILCDAKLRELLGVESISALGISEMVTHKHLFQRA